MAAEAVQHDLDVDLPHALERPREEGVQSCKFTRLLHFDVTLPVLGVEALQRQNLFLGDSKSLSRAVFSTHLHASEHELAGPQGTRRLHLGSVARFVEVSVEKKAAASTEDRLLSPVQAAASPREMQPTRERE